MLLLTIPAAELFDDRTQEFIKTPEYKLQMEHSLVSLSKWESKWGKPFLSKEPKTAAETIDYIKCMTITQNVNPKVYNSLTTENIEQINKYIDECKTKKAQEEKENKKKTKKK